MLLQQCSSDNILAQPENYGSKIKKPAKEISNAGFSQTTTT
jgi:hypothetical protein